MEHMERYRFVWRTMRACLGPWLRHKFNYSAELCSAAGPLLVLSNHNTDWDPLLLSLSFPNYMSFVASEHIFRRGFVAKLLVFLVNPIARLKGTTAGDTALTMVRRLRKGGSVAMFAEGNRSFDGRTGAILPATGKLVRSSGASLVTFRMDGGYLTSPRWSGKHIRRGKMRGSVVRVYSPEELKAMSVDEINAAICKDLFVDAYAVQRREMIPFVGKHLAEGLETVLCRCPKCGKLDTLRSAGNTLSCTDCDFTVHYNKFGFFEGEDAPFDNLTDWDRAQTEALLASLPTDGSAIFSDTCMTLRENLSGHDWTELGTGELVLYADRLECCGRSFPLDELGGFALHGAQDVDFSAAGHSYAISSDRPRCTRKYMLVIQHLLAETAAK